jgi:hypothetical protein
MTDGSALWQMDMPTNKETELYHAANTAVYFNTASEIVRFMHAAMGYPVLATLDRALAMGLVKGFPGLTQQTLRKHPPFSDATIKGHMAQTRKNVKSTKPPQQKREGEAENPRPQIEGVPHMAQSATTPTSPNEYPGSETQRENSTTTHSAQRELPPPSRTKQSERADSEGQMQQGERASGEGTETELDEEPDNENADGIKRCYASLFQPKKTSYAGQTGEFVCQSTAKNKYVHILYDYTSNHIFAEPIQSTSDTDITRAFTKCIGVLQNAGIKPEMHMLDKLLRQHVVNGRC